MQDFRFRGKGLSVWAGKVVGRGSQTFKADPQGTWVSCRRDGLRRCACRAVIECEPYFRPAVLQKMQRFVLTFLCGGSALGRGSDFAFWQGRAQRQIALPRTSRRPSWLNTCYLARESVALANPVRTFGSLAPPNANADTPTRFFCGAGTIGATKPILMPATNKSAAQYTR
jgi:hypothetical protein